MRPCSCAQHIGHILPLGWYVLAYFLTSVGAVVTLRVFDSSLGEGAHDYDDDSHGHGQNEKGIATDTAPELGAESGLAPEAWSCLCSVPSDQRKPE